jgi:hypothetical protein
MDMRFTENGIFYSDYLDEFVKEVCFDEKTLDFKKYWDGEKFHLHPFFMDLADIHDGEAREAMLKAAEVFKPKETIKH